MAYSSPRKQRIDFDSIENAEQRSVAKLVANIIKEKNTSQEDFAKELGVSLASISNVFRPKFGRAPSIKLLTAIAKSTSNARETYTMLLEAGGYDVERYPYIFDSREEFRLSKKLSEQSIIASLSQMVLNSGIRCSIESSEMDRPSKFDYVIKYDDYKYDYWKADISVNTRDDINVIKEALYHVACDNSSEKTKYSIIVDNEKIFSELLQYKFPTLHNEFSIILFNNNSFVEGNLVTYTMTDIAEPYEMVI